VFTFSSVSNQYLQQEISRDPHVKQYFVITSHVAYVTER